MAAADGFLVKLARLLLPLAGAGAIAWIGGYWAAVAAGEKFTRAWIEETAKPAPIVAAASGLPAERGRRPSLLDFAAADPFDAPVSAPAAREPEKKQVTADELSELEKIRIAGAIPGISAWIEDEGSQGIYLPGQKIRGFELLKVDEAGVVLRKDGAEVRVLLRYSSGTASPGRAPAPPPLKQDGRIAAARPGQQGSIPRETVDNLLMNPLDEMKKFRLRPAFDGGKALGVEVQWMDRGSFLESVGVEKGDVIQSVNGLEIRNMGDVVNVVNSLMGGDAFDVQVLRGGQAVSLKYNIR
ncbi:MAG: type II secretion system protein GspC [Aminivibrio sp.]